SDQPKNDHKQSDSSIKTSISLPPPPVQQTMTNLSPSTEHQTSTTKPSVSTTTITSSLHFDTSETKMKNIQKLTQELKNEHNHFTNGNTMKYTNENDTMIDYIYKIGNKHRLFIDYRPDITVQTVSTHTFTTLISRGKLYIDEVYICSGQGPNKKQCKQVCFLRAHDYLVNHDYEVRSSMNDKDKKVQYDLIVKDLNEFDENESCISRTMIPQMCFVEAKDTSTIAENTFRQQVTTEQQYWQHDNFDEKESASVQSLRSPSTTISHSSLNYTALKKDENVPYPFPRQQRLPSPSLQQHTQQEKIFTADVVNTSSIILDEHPPSFSTLSISQQLTKLTKLQPFLFSLLNCNTDVSQSIDLISTQINKYDLQLDFKCSETPSVTQRFHGYLIVEQIYISDGYGLNKKLAKKDTYFNGLKLISQSKSFSLELRNKQQWTLISFQDDQGLLKCPPPSLRSIIYHDRDQNRDRPIGGQERVHEQHREKLDDMCISPPIINNNYDNAPSFSRRMNEKTTTVRVIPPIMDLSKYVTTSDDEILSNIRKLIPSNFVIFEPVDFQPDVPGSYISMLFVSMSKNHLELKHDVQHTIKGFLVTFYIGDHFLMSMLTSSNKNCTKQVGAMKLCELLKTIFPCIKMKSIEHMIEDSGTPMILDNARRITRAHLYEQPDESRTTSNINNLKQLNENDDGGRKDIATKLMKKMGWTGTGGLGKQGQGITEPIQIVDLHGRQGLGSNHLFPNKIFIRSLRRILEEYIQQNVHGQELVFENQFSNEERKIIHKEATKLHLNSRSYGQNQQRFICVTHNQTADELMNHLIQHNGKTQRYELKSDQNYQFKSDNDTSTIITSSLNEGIQIPPMIIYKDACDDDVW
ncbi:unnamed protein product, partial [Didymodactylos carnosus]